MRLGKEPFGFKSRSQVAAKEDREKKGERFEQLLKRRGK
jgi:hypothetical protein